MSYDGVLTVSSCVNLLFSGSSVMLRSSPSTGELIASGADDGMLIIWTREDKPQTSIRGRDTKDISADKEAWRVLSAIR